MVTSLASTGFCRALLTAAALAVALPAQTLVQGSFDADAGQLVYRDDCFRGTAQPAFASGFWNGGAGRGGSGGCLQMELGGLDDQVIEGMSGGWVGEFELSQDLLPGQAVVLSFWFRMVQGSNYETDEFSEVLLSVDGEEIGELPNQYLAQMRGNGNGGATPTTGWRSFRAELTDLTAGTHEFVIGGYNNKKTAVDEVTQFFVDDVHLGFEAAADVPGGVAAALAGLDYQRFVDNMAMLSSFGDRVQGSPDYLDAEAWLAAELEAAGYTVEYHDFMFHGFPRRNIYVTKVGAINPDRMFIVSAHLDGVGNGGAVDDDASGVSLVLECARAIARPEFETDCSIRFLFFNSEETGIFGSGAYVGDRHALQGVESPPGSGLYPEPRWLGMIQHDMILYDHGFPPQPNQIPEADMDFEYQASSACAQQSQALAELLLSGNLEHALRYPAEIGDNMALTDSVRFQDFCAAVSVRENMRATELALGSNPHHHAPTDVMSSYSEDDMRFGFDVLRTTLGSVAGLAGLQLRPNPVVASFGGGCPGAAGIPRLIAFSEGLPTTGEQFDLLITDLADEGVPIGLLGFSDTEYAGLSLPANLGFLGLGGCTLYTSVERSFALLNQRGAALWPLQVPADPALIHEVFNLQVLVMDESALPVEVSLSNALKARIGAP